MSVGESTSATADVILNSVGRPLRGASLFYALYWLVEIEGIEAAAFDFQQLRQEYHDGFYWYGIYSIARELSHINEEYLVEGFSVGEHTRNLVRDVEFMDDVVEERQLSPVKLRRHAASLIREDDLEDLAGKFFTQAPDLSAARPVDTEAGIREIADMLNELQIIGAMERPRAFARMALDVFDNARYVEFGDDTREQLDSGFGELPPAVRDAPPGSDVAHAFAQLNPTAKARLAGLSGWRVGDFDGPGWLGIADHLLRRDQLSQTAWVDQSWALTHNNGNWLNKVEPLGFSLAEEINADIGGGGRNMVLPLGVLMNLLDANQEGDMETVFDVAVRFNDQVGIDLRRLRRQVGV